MRSLATLDERAPHGVEPFGEQRLPGHDVRPMNRSGLMPIRDPGASPIEQQRLFGETHRDGLVKRKASFLSQIVARASIRHLRPTA